MDAIYPRDSLISLLSWFAISVWGTPIINNLTQSADTSSKFSFFLNPSNTYTLRPQSQQDNDTCVVVTSDFYLQLGSCSKTPDNQKVWWISKCQ